MGACVVLKGFIEYAAVILIFRAQAVRVHEPSATSTEYSVGAVEMLPALD
jgi:hypothetical protein